MYHFDNPDLPTLQPWVLRRPSRRRSASSPSATPTSTGSTSTGQQLPYIDRLILEVVDGKLIPVKTGAGETDLQAPRPRLQGLHLPQGERGPQRADDAAVARPRAAPIWRSIPTSTPPTRSGAGCSATCASAARCRSASTATRSARSSISASAIAGNNTVLPESPLYRPEYRYALRRVRPGRGQPPARRDRPDKRDDDGVRLLPDGRPMDLIVETSGEDNEQTDVLELVDRELARDRHQGLHQALGPADDAQPRLCRRGPDVDVVRHRQRRADRRHGPLRLRPDHPAPAAMAEMGPVLRDQRPGRRAAGSARGQAAARSCTTTGARRRTTEERREIWHEMLDDLQRAGATRSAWSPACCSRSRADERLRNLPEEAIFNWEPHGQFGIYLPDTFWFEDGTE